MNREVHVRFCERPGVRFPRATHPYLRSAVRGSFYYLYLVEDIWSRKIVGWAVHEEESMDLAARLIDDTATRVNCDRSGLVLHSDNGGPMKGSTMLATLQRLGIVPSFSLKFPPRLEL